MLILSDLDSVKRRGSELGVVRAEGRLDRRALIVGNRPRVIRLRIATVADLRCWAVTYGRVCAVSADQKHFAADYAVSGEDSVRQAE